MWSGRRAGAGVFWSARTCPSFPLGATCRRTRNNTTGSPVSRVKAAVTRGAVSAPGWSVTRRERNRSARPGLAE